MNSLASAKPELRRDLFNEVAFRRNMSPVIIEKDFWFCWTLLQLLDASDLRNHLVFKGGTSLSKVYSAIQRFSEDIDLSIAEDYLGVPEDHPTSKSQYAKRLDRIKASCEQAVQHRILPTLIEQFSKVLGVSTHRSWQVSVDADSRES